MADISKITLPDNSQYDIKVYTDHIASMMSKTFTGVIGTATNWTDATFFYGKILPNDFNCIWRITYRITAECAGRDDAKSIHICTASGRANTILSYANWNSIVSTTYRPLYYNVYYRAKAAGITNGYGHLLGTRLYSAWNYTTAANSRTIQIDIIRTENCTFEFFNSPIKYSNAPGTGSTNYDGASEYNIADNGLRESGDDNSVNEYAGGITAGPNGLKAYSLALKINEDHWESLHTSSYTTATTKVKNSTGFLVTSPMIYCNGTYNSGVVSSASATYFAAWSVDTRYSFNVSNSWSAIGRPLYLVGTIAGDKFYLKDTTWWADELPVSADGHYYWYVGQMNSAYQVALHAYHPIYYYDNGIKQYNVTTVTEVNGHTVNSDVPTNAKFTDTTYESKAAASGGTAVSLVTTGEKYTWNSKTSNTGTVTKVSTGVGLTGGDITTTGTVKAKLKSETASTLASAAMGSTVNRQYAVGVDKDGYLSVNVPWAADTDTNVTNTLNNTAKAYLTGTTTATTNTGTQVFDNGIYTTTTAGQLNATTYKVNEKVTLQYDTTAECLNFVFS